MLTKAELGGQMISARHAQISSWEEAVLGTRAIRHTRTSAAWTYVDSGIGLVKKRTGVREQP